MCYCKGNGGFLTMRKQLYENAKKAGYNNNLCKYLAEAFYLGSPVALLNAIKEKVSEKEILILSFEEPFIDEVMIPIPGMVLSRQEDESVDFSDAATQKYLSHCNPDGSFRYEDFLN